MIHDIEMARRQIPALHDPNPFAAKTTIVEWEDHTFRFWLPNPNDHIQRVICLTRRFYEIEMLEDVACRAYPGTIAIDVGANIGNHTVFLAGACNLRCIAIEPEANNLHIASVNIALNGLGESVELYRLAAGKRLGQGQVIVPSHNNMGMTFVRTDVSGNIQIVPLDMFEFSAPVSIVKIDVEGMELEVLEGAESLLRKQRPSLYVETSSREVFTQVSGYLGTLGYEATRQFNWTPTIRFDPLGSPCAPTSELESKKLRTQALELIQTTEEAIAYLRKTIATGVLDQAMTVIADIMMAVKAIRDAQHGLGIPPDCGHSDASESLLQSLTHAATAYQVEDFNAFKSNIECRVIPNFTAWLAILNDVLSR